MWMIAAALAACAAPGPAGTGAEARAAEPWSYPIVRKGELVRYGKPYRAVGVNYFDCFYKTLTTAGDTGYEQGFAELAKRGIPFVRFNCGGFWPVDWKLYREKPAEYFALMDRVVRSAEKHRVGLIPSICWYMATFPDLVGEPMDAWGDPSSKTIAFMRKYTREVVTRYAGSPAIWGWELGNEYSLAADLPNASEHRPPIWANLGTAASRSKRDDLTHEMIRTACREFALEVRRHDKRRMVISGNSIPRPTAWHQMKELSWTADTPEQYREMLVGDNPDPIDTLCIHAYEPGDFDRLASSMQASRASRKLLYVGEFGIKGVTPEVLATFRSQLERVLASGCALASAWNFTPAGDSEYNFGVGGPRGAMLEELAQANRRLAP